MIRARFEHPRQSLEGFLFGYRVQTPKQLHGLRVVNSMRWRADLPEYDAAGSARTPVLEDALAGDGQVAVELRRALIALRAKHAPGLKGDHSFARFVLEDRELHGYDSTSRDVPRVRRGAECFQPLVGCANRAAGCFRRLAGWRSRPASRSNGSPDASNQPL